MSSTYCKLPFLHLYSQPDGELKPCYLVNEQLDLLEYWSEPYTYTCLKYLYYVFDQSNMTADNIVI